MNVAELLKGSNYNFTLFTESEINAFQKCIVFYNKGGVDVPYVNCFVRDKEVRLTPEEAVRQLYIQKLILRHKYQKQFIQVEVGINFGREVKRADIVIYDKNKPDSPYIIVEVKKHKLRDGKEQLKSYCNATGAPISIWSNGSIENFYHRQDPNYFSELSELPNGNENLFDFLSERNKYTILDLLLHDNLEKRSLKDIIEELEDEVLANAGVDVFEECFKLIFTKLYDEKESGEDITKIQNFLELYPEINLDDFKELVKKGIENVTGKTETEKHILNFLKGPVKKFRKLEFRNIGTDKQIKDNFEKLFLKAQNKWKGIFPQGTTLDPIMSDTHISICISYLQNIKLFNSNLEVVDEAFEYLVNKSNKGEKGQYFTPRYVIDMCVKMLNPKPEEYIIDTAAGSCGFPVHTIFKVWQELNPDEDHLFTAKDKTKEQTEYVREKVFAIDFDSRAVRVGKTLNIIAGDGETNVMLLNSLDYDSWNHASQNPSFISNYGKGFDKLEDLRTNKDSIRINDDTLVKDFSHFNFDIVMANPPFAGDIKDSKVITKYELGKKRETRQVKDANRLKTLSKDKGWHEKISRDILFIERNLNMLKPGGRMAVVLPQGRFNNSSDKEIREFIVRHCRILAVVGLHQNTFKPHTGTKTSVLFVQKWNNDKNIGTYCPKKEDYNIFFATQQVPGKDSGGDKVFETEEAVSFIDLKANEVTEMSVSDFSQTYGDSDKILNDKKYKSKNASNAVKFIRYKRDKYGHQIVKHDLFNTDGLTQDGIAEAFIEFAKQEKLSFF